MMGWAVRQVLGNFRAVVVVCLALATPGVLHAQQAPVASPPTAPVAPAAPPAPAAVQPAQPLLPPEMLEPITRLSKSIESAESSIQQLKELEGELSRLRADVEQIIYESTSAADGLRPQLAEVRSQIEKLGPPPKAGEPPETETVASERARLNAMAGALDSAIKTTELAWVRAKQLIDRITVYRYQMFTRNLFERRESPMLPAVWRNFNARIEAVVTRLAYYGSDWSGWAAKKSNELWGLLALAFTVWLGLTLLARGYVRRRLVVRTPSPSFFERAQMAARVVPLRMLAPAAALILLYVGFVELELLFPPWTGTGLAVLKAGLVFSAASALLGTTLAPKHPGWRMIPVSNATASRLAVALTAFVGVYALDTVLIELSRVVYAPLTVTIVHTFLIAMVNVVMLAGLLLTRFEPQIGPDRPVNGHEYVPGVVTRHSPLWVKLPLWIVAAAILVSSMLGYVAFGRFVAHQLVLSGIVIGTGVLIYLAIRSATRGRGDDSSIIGEKLGAKFGLEGSRRRQITWLVEFTGTLVLIFLAVPLLFLQWGYATDEIRDWMRALLFGFEIGQFRISLFRILVGLALFTAMLFVTRLMQRWLRDQVLTHARMDAGIANSIDTAVGYAGMALALLLAVSYAGFDITNLAIVAGALSVGIGFGLQSIVNNFVSGLILLVERPIKVGDWIVIGGDQGNVRRISVRSTEIETFDRSSLIVPNAELISSRVINWTHRNQLGRTAVKITLDGSMDPEKVLTVLRECAAEHPEVLQTPPPSVTFDSFTNTTLEFTIRVVLSDVYKGGNVSTELRVAILKRLRAEGLVGPVTMPADAPSTSG